MATARPLRIAFVTFGSGSGDLMFAASLSAALTRANVNHTFSALSNSNFHYLFSDYFEHIRIRPQPRYLFRQDRETDIYNAIQMVQPQLLVVSMIWLPLLPILHELPGTKVFLARISPDHWWRIEDKDGKELRFDPAWYDHAFVIEPNAGLTWGTETEPLVVCNTDEAVGAEDARAVLGAEPGRKTCVVAQNGYAGELQRLLDRNGLQPEEYQTIALENVFEGRNVFPLAKYMRGIDFLVGGAGYNLFYEARFFDTPAHLAPFERNGDDQFRRIKVNRDYSFTRNGADQIVERILEDRC